MTCGSTFKSRFGLLAAPRRRCAQKITEVDGGKQKQKQKQVKHFLHKIGLSTHTKRASISWLFLITRVRYYASA
ncbi:hypothetical protein BCT30_09335 [Enterovibrio norvegicus]|nr:hypothetical protein BCU46_17530 [Enterovibrio norvegicus]PMN54919.1 hypothetical protein BCT30_09335 [Enterovibrio norvegicus]